MASERNPSALVVSLDLHLHRARLMRQLTGSGTVVAADARRLPFDHRFDCIIADVPCSGTGTLSRNPEIKWRLLPDDLPRFANLQFEILNSVAKHAETVVYSTCSLEPEEGEEVVNRFLSHNHDFRISPVKPLLHELGEEGLIRTEVIENLAKADFLRTFPGLHRCDGFFAAVIEKT